MAHLVEVIGPGCRRCTELLEVVREVAQTECPDVEARYISDPVEIVGRGFFMRTPALVVDGHVVATGRVPARAEVCGWLTSQWGGQLVKVIEVLGPGCQKCQHVETIVREIVDDAGLEAEVRHVTDMAEIASRGVLSTPGLVIDGTIVSVGRVPTRDQVRGWLGVT